MRSTRQPYTVVLVRNGPIKRHLREYLDAVCFSEATVQCVQLASAVPERLALQAGMDSIAADAYVCIAADGNDDPQSIVELIRKWKNGSDCVFAIRNSTSQMSRRQKIVQRVYDSVARRCGTPITNTAANYCLLDRKVVQSLQAIPADQATLAACTSKLGVRRSLVGMNDTWRRTPSVSRQLLTHFRTLRDAMITHSRTPVRAMYLAAAGVLAIACGSILCSLCALTIGVSTGSILIGLVMAGLSSICLLTTCVVIAGEMLYRLLQNGPAMRQYSVLSNSIATCSIRPAQSASLEESQILAELGALQAETQLSVAKPAKIFDRAGVGQLLSIDDEDN